ncbi:MAG TPA: 23S rRNA (guanosine(2251)-2'-O)-methyltransferase RlmB [Streptosporangiaceae bacterium]
MTGRGSPRRGPGGTSKRGKPRPGTGGNNRRSLEGKGPTPPAQLRPGHPAQRRAAAKAGPRGAAGQRSADGAARSTGRPPAAGQAPTRARGAGSAAEVIAGRNPVLETLRSPVPVVALHVGPRLDQDERISQAIAIAADRGIPVVEAGRQELDRFSGGAIHQGIALRVRPYSYAHPEDLPARAAKDGEPPLIVALDGVTDPRNLGAIVRSTAAFGGHGVVVPVRRSAGVTAGAWKSSAGTLARLPVAQAPNLARALAAYQDAGLFVAGLDAGASVAIDELELADGPLVLVVGSEGQGLSRLIAERCDVLASIPIRRAAESLNAGIAAGIALYEVSRRRAISGSGRPATRSSRPA